MFEFQLDPGMFFMEMTVWGAHLSSFLGLISNLLDGATAGFNSALSRTLLR